MRTGAVVISYARSDGHELADGVRDHLTGLGHDVWLDVFDMRPGQDWWRQIEDRIERAKALVPS